MFNVQDRIDMMLGSRVVKCSYCDGDGLDENMKTCPKCDGTGEEVIP